MRTRYVPAEWQPHEAVWLAWPGHPEEWLGDLEPARRSVAALCRAIAGQEGGEGDLVADAERIELLVLDDDSEASARAALGSLPVNFHRVPFGDIWLRDTGPVFVCLGHEDGRGSGGDPGGDALGAVCFEWNGWGDKYLFEHDAEVSGRIAGLTGAVAARHDWILEGGAIDSDGAGTLLTTRQCLLEPNRNPGLDQAGIEARLRDGLGARRVLWLERGLIGDHTDGHVDNLARFVAPGTVVCMRASGDDDPNSEIFGDIAAALRGFRDAAGRQLEVIEIPSPGLVLDAEGAVVPASYMNFYIANQAVVVPVYGRPGDDEAVATLAGLFPGRRVVGLDAHAVLVGGGAFHCITRDQPEIASTIEPGIEPGIGPDGESIP